MKYWLICKNTFLTKYLPENILRFSQPRLKYIHHNRLITSSCIYHFSVIYFFCNSMVGKDTLGVKCKIRRHSLGKHLWLSMFMFIRYPAVFTTLLLVNTQKTPFWMHKLIIVQKIGWLLFQHFDYIKAGGTTRLMYIILRCSP